MTKAQRILSLYDNKRTTAEIAAIVECDPAYVRVVARQRRGKLSDADVRYCKKRYGTASMREAYRKRGAELRADPVRYGRWKEWRRAWCAKRRAEVRAS
jgi:intein-encoded DNA endonuclease-like protein